MAGLSAAAGVPRRGPGPVRLEGVKGRRVLEVGRLCGLCGGKAMACKECVRWLLVHRPHVLLSPCVYGMSHGTSMVALRAR
jgi:hypothetical protein